MRVTQKQAIKQLRELKRLGKEMRLAADGWPSKFQTLVAIIISARTRDEVTIEVAKKLFARYPTAVTLARAPRKSIEQLVHPVNFFRNKTKSVLACARILSQKYNGIPPKGIDELVSLPGVGRKTANVFLAQYGVNAIGVDTHVAYISKKLGWTRHQNPEKIEKDLERLFPKRMWRSLNTTCVRFGKTHIGRKKKNVLLDAIRSLV